jgi:hypothetical protein
MLFQPAGGYFAALLRSGYPCAYIRFATPRFGSNPDLTYSLYVEPRR